MNAAHENRLAYEQEITRRISEHINSGRTRIAVLLGAEYLVYLISGMMSPMSAHFWFQYGLANLLDDNEEAFELARISAAGCDDYDQLIEGDFLRDLAIHAIRQGNTERANSLIVCVRDLHAGDKNRLAAAKFVEGRIAAAEGRFANAYDLYGSAEADWWDLEQTHQYWDRQWRRNNRFSRMLVTAMLPDGGEVRWRAVNVVLDGSEKRRARRLIALAMLIAPRLAGRTAFRKLH